MPVPSRCEGVGLILIILVSAASILHDPAFARASPSTARTNVTRLNASYYWTEDHPHNHRSHYKRLPDGSVVPSNKVMFNSSEDYRDAVANQTSWISRWVLSEQGRRTLKKDIPRLLMYNLVSPMDYGSSLRSSNVRRRRNRAARMFLTDNLALPLLKTIGNVAWNLIDSHYVGYFEDEIFAQRLKMMNSSEMIAAFNLTPSMNDSWVDDDEESRSNVVLAYEDDGQSKRAFLYAQYTTGFSPFEGYADKYYNRDDDLPPPTFPADSYPWLWSPRLDLIRELVLQLKQSLDLNDDTMDGSSDIDDHGQGFSSSAIAHETPDSEKALRLLSSVSPIVTSNDEPTTIGRVDASASSSERLESGGKSLIDQDMRALKEIHQQLQEYHFDTGIPRFTMQSNTTHSIFPTLTEFLSINQTIRDGDNVTSFGSQSGNPDIAEIISPVNSTQNGVDIAGRSAVYAALVHFYAYPSNDKQTSASLKQVASDTEETLDCSVERQCLMESGVTVYTPSLTNLTLFKMFADGEVSQETKRAARLEVLQEIAQLAFDAERRALKHGLQAPSTVWYSTHDLDTDEFADAVLGTVNTSLTIDSTPLHVFESLMKDKAPILDEVVSYYADTNHDTKVAMLSTSVPKLDKFEGDELLNLIDLMQDEMNRLDRAVNNYVQTRDADPQYQELVNATVRGDVYNGSEYTLLGFGFVIPATNDKNVLYHDMKLPVPFHLALRLVVRFQESRLLLPEESRQLLVCLAMALNGISFYRCRSAGSSSSHH